MNKEQRRSYITSRASELARSGKYNDYMAIERAIRTEGYSEARDVLDDRFLREELDRQCNAARKCQ